ncbi:MAG: hypothetical protein ABI678_01620 [Kofleriaceae bacterium]
MRRTLIALLVTSAACGHPAKSTTPPAPLPEDKKAEPVAEAPKPVPVPQDPNPIDVPLAMGKATYKLASAGKGTKTVLKISGEQGAPQQLELALDLAGKQIAPPELGGTQEDVAPTLVLASALEVGDSDKDGAKFKVTFNGVDARDRQGAKATKDQFKTELGVLAGVQLSGAVSPTGQLSNMSLHVDKPNDKTMAALELIRISMMPMWPILPTEAIGVGAKWTVSTTYTIADRIEATQTTDYEVLSHKGAEWKLKGTTKLAGKEQMIKETKFEKIGGAGGVEVTLTDGSFLPVSATKLANDFTATVSVPGGDPAKPSSVQFHLEQGLAVTPAGATPVTPPATPVTPAAKTPAAPAAKAPAATPPAKPAPATPAK